MPVQKNEDVQRYDDGDVREAWRFMQSSNPMALVRQYSRLFSKFLENAHWVFDNVKSGYKNGEIILEDLLFIKCVSHCYRDDLNKATKGKKTAQSGALISVAVLFITGVLWYFFFGPNSGVPAEVIQNSRISYIVNLLTLILFIASLSTIFFGSFYLIGIQHCWGINRKIKFFAEVMHEIEKLAKSQFDDESKLGVKLLFPKEYWENPEEYWENYRQNLLSKMKTRKD